jgi:hypothetical protein
MPLTRDQINLQNRVSRQRLINTNSVIREQLNSGVPIETIAKQVGGKGLDPMDVLGAMSLAETHQITPNEAMSVLPSLMKQTYGDEFVKSDVVRSYFTESDAFKLPVKTFTPDDARAQVATEEKQVPAFGEEFQPVLRNDRVSLVGGFGQAYSISSGLGRLMTESSWFEGDISKEHFFKGMLQAETEEEREGIRDKRAVDILTREAERVSGLRKWEDRQKQLFTDEPGVWQSKANAWSAGSARVSSAALDASSDVLRFTGTLFDSETFNNSADNLAKWARAYHKATQEPELATISVNAFDDTINAFLQNAPYVGTTVAAAMFSPDKVTPFTVFFMATAMESSGIRQTSLDNGIPEKSARARGWIGGSINGAIEAYSGGAAKYNPKRFAGRLAALPGKLTKNALKEIFQEEIPQEIVSALFSNDVPMTDEQELDWDEITNRLLLLARDTAFTSTVFTGGAATIAEVAQWDARRVNNRQTVQAMNDAVNFVLDEQRAVEDVETDTPTQAKKVKAKDIVDEIKVETPVETEDIAEVVGRAQSFGAVKQPDGRYAVINWETQQEIQTGMKRKAAQKEAQALSSNNALIPQPSRPRDILPTAQDTETLTHGQLLNIVFKKVAQQSKKIVIQKTKDFKALGKDLSVYAKTSLEGLDITESQRNAILRKVATAVSETERTQAVQTIESIKEISRKNRATSKFKQLRRTFNKASKKRISDGGIHHKVHGILSALLKDYTTLPARTLNTIKRAETYLNSIRDDVAQRHNPEYAKALIPRGITDKFRELASTKISDMSSDQIEELNNQINRFLKMAQLYGKLATSQMVRKAKNFLNNATANVKIKQRPTARRKFSPKRGFQKKLFDGLVGIKNDDIYTIATRIWGKFDPISTLIMKGRRQQLGLTLKYTDMLRQAEKDAGITPDLLKFWSPLMHQIPISQRVKEIFSSGTQLYDIKIGGKLQQFTMAELMSFVMHTRNSYNVNQAVKNGIATREGEIGKLSEEQFTEMASIVEGDPAATAFVDFLESFYIEMGQDINRVSRELDGIDIATLDNYFHVEYLPEGGVTGVEYVRDALVDEDGRLKARTSSNRPVMVRDIFEVITEDMRAISQFAGTTETVRMLRSLVNYAPFREKLRNTGNEGVLTELDSRVRNFQRERQSPSGDLERAVSKIDSGMAQAILTNPVIWALQPTSAVLYSTEASFKYMKAIRPTLKSETRALLERNWVLFRTRVEGIGASKSLASPGTVKRIFTGTGNIKDLALAGMHKGDIMGVSRAAQIVMAEMSDNKLEGKSRDWWKNYGVEPSTLEFNSEGYWQAFNDRADYMVTRTQPMFFDENKSHFTGSDNPLVRSLTRFRGFIDQIGRIIRRQVAEVQVGDTSKVEASKNIGVALALVSVVSTTIRHLFDLLFGKEHEDGDFLRDLITSPLSLIPFVGYPAKQIASALLGADVTAPEFSAMPIIMMESIFKHSLDIAKGVRFSVDDELVQGGKNRGRWKSEVFFKRGIQGVTEDYLTLHGVPIRTIKKIEWWKE